MVPELPQSQEVKICILFVKQKDRQKRRDNKDTKEIKTQDTIQFQYF